ncbi:cupin domain-containing protein [Pseudomonas sp. Irchel s3b5]|uniref:cupin domain-containing protein n=1 Tax=Pseudomonas sp. Irchel s3b5 TaxID=2009077 RepID=UPI000BA35BDB|nr:cupin domain-containing protein [Pseudomonas sp. Irchel s3b5]
MSTALPRHVIDFANRDLAPRETEINDPAVVDAPYRSSSWRHFVRPDKNAVAGIWEAGPHLERCQCDYDELCHILEGTVRLTDTEGVSRTFTAGDSFVVASGFNGMWENLTPVRKVYFILG